MNDRNANRNGYKETKVGWIPNEWNLRVASDYAPYVTSGSRGWADYYSEEGNLFLRIANLRRESPFPDLSNRKNVALPSELQEGKRTCLRDGDLVVSITADLGIIGYISNSIPSPAYISQHLALLRFPDNAKINRLYCAYALCSERLRNHFVKITDQGAKAGLNLDAIRSLPIVSPPVAEQDQIAKILSTCDVAIEKTCALIQAKQQQKKGMMQQLLTGKKRLSGFAGAWKTMKLGKLLKELSRPVDWDDEASYNLISVRRRSGGLFFREALDGHEILTKVMRTTHTGDFLISKMQVVHGAMAMTTKEFDGGHVSGSYITLVVKDGSALHMPFFDYLSRTKWLYHLAFISSYGVVIEKMTFNLRDFLKKEIQLPPTIEEQARICEVLNTCEQEEVLLTRKLATLQEQKKALMQKLLTGQVRVKI